MLATWKLPVGARSHRKTHGGECRYTLTQQHGIDASFKIYSLRIGSHVLAVPAGHIDGNLVITLPNRLSNQLIKLSRNL